MDKAKKKKLRPGQIISSSKPILKGKVAPITAKTQKKKTKKDMEYWKMLKLAMKIEKKEKKIQKNEKNKKAIMLKEMREKRKQKNLEKFKNLAVKFQPKKKSVEKQKKRQPSHQRDSKRTASIKGKYLEKAKLKYYMRRGNNKNLLESLMKKRGWWASIVHEPGEGRVTSGRH